MRTKFIPQMNFGAVPIGEIEFDVFNRHELIQSSWPFSTCM